MTKHKPFSVGFVHIFGTWNLNLLKDQMCVKGKHPWLCDGISGMKRNENGKTARPGRNSVMAPGTVGTQRGISTRMNIF